MTAYTKIPQLILLIRTTVLMTLSLSWRHAKILKFMEILGLTRSKVDPLFCETLRYFYPKWLEWFTTITKAKRENFAWKKSYQN